MIQLFGQSQRYFTPTVSQPGTAKLMADEPAMKQDPRFTLYPDWLRLQATGQARPRPVRRGAPAFAVPLPGEGAGAQGKFVVAAMRAGARIVAGTDTPNAFALHGELETYVMAGMTPYEALRAATVVPAEALNLDAGSIEAGKLADIVIVQGNPLENIADAHRVKTVIANGRVFEEDDLVKGNTKSDRR